MPMDPIQMLLDDHEKVRALYREYQQAGNDQQKLQTARTILHEVEVHSNLEEQIFYPAVEQKGTGQLKQIIHHGEEEHAKVDQVLMELKSMGTMSKQFATKFGQLMDDVEHHVQEEESEMLPQARQVLGNDTEYLALQMQRLKQQLMSGVR